MCTFCESYLWLPCEDSPLSSSESNLYPWCSSASHSLFSIFLSLSASQTVLYRLPLLPLPTPLASHAAPLPLQQIDTGKLSLPFWNLDNLRQYLRQNRPFAQRKWLVEFDHLMRDRIGTQHARDCEAQSEGLWRNGEVDEVEKKLGGMFQHWAATVRLIYWNANHFSVGNSYM